MFGQSLPALLTDRLQIKVLWVFAELTVTNPSRLVTPFLPMEGEWLLGSYSMHRNNLGSSLQLIQKICPLLHHHPAFFDELCAIVGRTQVIGNTVRQLMLDYFRGNTHLLMEDCPCHRSKTVPRHLILCVVPHASQSGINGRIAHCPAIATCPGKDKFGMTTEGHAIHAKSLPLAMPVEQGDQSSSS